MLYHIQIQRFPKSPGADNQGYRIIVLSPFFDQHSFINIKIII